MGCPWRSSTAGMICINRGGVTTISTLLRRSTARRGNDCENAGAAWEVHMMSRLIFAVIILVTSTTVSLSDDMTGQASIIDGDTLEIHGTRIRLWGVDAPDRRLLEPLVRRQFETGIAPGTSPID